MITGNFILLKEKKDQILGYVLLYNVKNSKEISEDFIPFQGVFCIQTENTETVKTSHIRSIKDLIGIKTRIL